MLSVLFVCTANICRSPMAMGLFRSRVDDDPEWRIESAGTWSIEGQHAASYTRAVLAMRGIDISDHRSRSVDREFLQQFNLILTMEGGQKEAISVEFPEIADRVYLISEMVDEVYNIDDPMVVVPWEIEPEVFETLTQNYFPELLEYRQ